MALGTPYITDSIAHTAANGQHQELTAAQLSTKYGSGNVKTSSVNFAFPWRGHVIQFRQNVPLVITDTALLAALAAAGAPIT